MALPAPNMPTGTEKTLTQAVPFGTLTFAKKADITDGLPMKIPLLGRNRPTIDYASRLIIARNLLSSEQIYDYEMSSSPRPYHLYSSGCQSRSQLN